ncbi:GIN domain-containing protein [Pontimicrobium aquaticum]|uniref:DUF2807 domain-containing protein n=1 Tax=Pontimicrobium aquaticum TaxID=2565367 RepID=A0A4U0EWT0_9FLAO|nr:DUF2807 domain-containing protein [Pontimicrobium aquaticum]TJY36248.1 DUF2807 domain-containing protein [Pontimicrobium aquaticum]
MMLKKGLLLTFILLLSTTLQAQKKERIKGNKSVTTQETPISSFNKILVGENFFIDIIEGESASVFIEADDNLHDVIKFNVADSVLTFKTTKKITSSKKLSIKVIYTKALKEIETIDDGEISSLTSVDLEGVSVKSSGTSKVFLNVKSQNFSLISSGRSKVKLNVTSNETKFELNDNSKLDALINADRMHIDLYNRSDAKVRGNLDKLKVRAGNSSNIVAKELVSINCEVLSEDNSDVAVNVTEELFIDVTGNGEVYIYNEPKITLNKFANTAKLHKKEI